MLVSIVMPALNERDNLEEVIPELTAVLDREGVDFEVNVVDDGSNDGTIDVLRSLAAADPRVRWIKLRRNFGKSAALQAAFAKATGDVIVLMDADGQDDPSEIPRLLERIAAGDQLVTGRRAQRRDRFIKRTTSRLYNAATAAMTGVHGRDFNSGLKAMTRDVVGTLHLYGELHRYIPVLAHWAGFSIGEVTVNHRERKHGVTKFGMSRFWRGFLDLLTVQLLTRFTARPLHLFGGIALLLGSAGGALLVWMFVLWTLNQPVGRRPALVAGVLLIVVAVQLLSIGLLAELFVHARGPGEVSPMIDDASQATMRAAAPADREPPRAPEPARRDAGPSPGNEPR